MSTYVQRSYKCLFFFFFSPSGLYTVQLQSWKEFYMLVQMHIHFLRSCHLKNTVVLQIAEERKEHCVQLHHVFSRFSAGLENEIEKESWAGEWYIKLAWICLKRHFMLPKPHSSNVQVFFDFLCHSENILTISVIRGNTIDIRR